MSKEARTALVFGIYPVVLNPTLLTAHNVLADALRICNHQRNLDSSAGFGDHHPGTLLPGGCRSEFVPLFRASVYARPAGIVVFGTFVALGVAKPILTPLGAIDLRRASCPGVTLHSSPKGV